MRELKVHYAPARGVSDVACGRVEDSVQDTRDPKAVTCLNCQRTKLYRAILIARKLPQ